MIACISKLLDVRKTNIVEMAGNEGMWRCGNVKMPGMNLKI